MRMKVLGLTRFARFRSSIKIPAIGYLSLPMEWTFSPFMRYRTHRGWYPNHRVSSCQFCVRSIGQELVFERDD